MKDNLITTYREILKQYKVKHKGILSLLQLFGDPEALVKEDKPKPLPIIEWEVPVMSLEAVSRREHSEDNTFRGMGSRKKRLDPYHEKNQNSWDMSILSEAHYASNIYRADKYGGDSPYNIWKRKLNRYE